MAVWGGRQHQLLHEEEVDITFIIMWEDILKNITQR